LVNDLGDQYQIAGVGRAGLGLLAFGDFWADLVHVGAGHAPSPQDRVHTLGREAICMCLNHIGIVSLVDADELIIESDGEDERPL
jgi:hypothetical protein